MTPAEWLRIAGVLACMLCGLPVVRRVTLRCGSSPEVARKSVHVAMGGICTAFPWIFDRPLPVWVLAAAATFPLLLLRSIPSLKHGIGSALHGVKRPSYGEVLFAPAVALVHHLAQGDPLLHVIPIAILTVADAAGALAGTRWGKRHYGCGEGLKTIEGSAIFLITAFLCAFLPLVLGHRLGIAPALLIALILATLAMMAEGLSDRGFDNLVIPLGSIFVLQRILDLETPALAWRLAALVALLALVLTGARWSTLNGGALLGSALLGYGCAVIADWRFALPPAAVFLCHLRTTRKHRLTGVFDHRLDAVVSHAISSMPWVIAVERRWLPADAALAGVSFAMAAQLGILDTATRLWLAVPLRPLRSTLKGVLIAALPGLVWLLPSFAKWAAPSAAALAAAYAAIRVFQSLQPRYHERPTRRWLLKGLLALAASAPALFIRP